MSHFLYVHKDLTGISGVWKIGQAITPYSAVRARQKFCWQQFGLDYLWFGFPGHIDFLEEVLKKKFRDCSGQHLQNFGTQTEIFKIDINFLRKEISDIIKEHNLCVRELILDTPYVASNSGQCPFKIPSEKEAYYWLTKKALEAWPDEADRVHERVYITTNNFNRLFETKKC